jgi:hypothetical protein
VAVAEVVATQRQCSKAPDSHREFQDSKKEAKAVPHKEKETAKKTCKQCGGKFETPNPKKETCSDKCRAAFSRKTRTERNN